MNFTKYVHEYVHQGEVRYAVAEWVERAAQYQWPLRESARKTSGASRGCSRYASASDWRYKSRKSALSAARRLYLEEEQYAEQEREIRGECHAKAD
jgi:hypothetical protein